MTSQASVEGSVPTRAQARVAEIEENLAAAKAKWDTLQDAYMTARKVRDAAGEDVARLSNELLIASRAAEREHFADPQLVAGLAHARRVEELARMERDQLLTRLRPEFQARHARNQSTLMKERRFEDPPLRGIDHIGLQLAEDPAVKAAEATLSMARSRRMQLGAIAHRQEKQQRLQASVQPRDARLAAASTTPMARLGAFASSELEAQEQKLVDRLRGRAGV
jgi:hypothetical protein